MTDIFEKTGHKKGIIHTGAASALGRMLNKRCQTLGIPLLNVVRREEQAELLKKEGAKHVVITQNDWEAGYKELVKEHGFNVFFDALGGGPVTEALVDGLGPNSWVHVYGMLESKPFTLKVALSLSRGVNVTGYMLFGWWSKLTEEEKNKVRAEYSSLLKGDLSTSGYK